MRRFLTITLLVLIVALVVRAFWTKAPWIRYQHVMLENGDVKIAATLALPIWKDGPYPIVVVLHGSGPTTRDDLKWYARKLVPHGMGVLTYDKRGTGKSTGAYVRIRAERSDVELTHLAGDVLACVEYLRKQYFIDKERIGLIGGSQAGWIMPIVASKSEYVSFFVSITGTPVTFGEEMHYSDLTKDGKTKKRPTEEEITKHMAAFKGPHGFDPMPILDTLSTPSYWLLGENDQSIPTVMSVKKLSRLRKAHPDLVEFKVYDGVGHGLVRDRLGLPVNYWPAIREWLSSHGFLDT